MPKKTKEILEFGPFRLDSGEALLTRLGTPVPLPPKVFDLLVYLVSNAGRLVEKEELLKALWPDSFVEEANLTINIAALRRALGSQPDGQPWIETVPKRGYRFLASVAHPGGAAATEIEITNGKVDGNNVTFEVKRQTQNGDMVSKYEGALSGDELKLKTTRPGQDGTPMAVEMTAKR